MSRRSRPPLAPCAKCPALTVSITGLCPEHRPTTGTRPVVTCSNCHERTRAMSGLCRDCSQDITVVDNDSPGVLDAEGWYNDRGIMRYIGGAA